VCQVDIDQGASDTTSQFGSQRLSCWRAWFLLKKSSTPWMRVDDTLRYWILLRRARLWKPTLVSPRQSKKSKRWSSSVKCSWFNLGLLLLTTLKSRGWKTAEKLALRYFNSTLQLLSCYIQTGLQVNHKLAELKPSIM